MKTTRQNANNENKQETFGNIFLDKLQIFLENKLIHDISTFKLHRNISKIWFKCRFQR